MTGHYTLNPQEGGPDSMNTPVGTASASDDLRISSQDIVEIYDQATGRVRRFLVSEVESVRIESLSCSVSVEGGRWGGGR